MNHSSFSHEQETNNKVSFIDAEINHQCTDVC